MAEELSIIGTTKEELYASLLQQIPALIGEEKDITAVLANTAAALKQTFDFFWVGFYIVKKDVLKLGPFQGTVACMEIQKGKGVCGTAWEQQTVQIIADVDKFPGHIACSNASKSEIVLPVLKNKKVVAVLDIDSDVYNDFDEVDQKKLTELCQWLSNYF
jgi:GAF domain-containing protein